MSTTTLLPRAALADVLLGRAPLVGSRVDPAAPRGFVSPVEARVHVGIPYGDLAREEARLLPELDLLSRLGVVARAAIASALAPAEDAAAAPRPWILSALVHNITIEEALEEILARPEGGHATMVHFVHPHALNLAASDADLASCLARADLVLPDGVGLRVAAKLLGVALRHNVNGTDLLPMLCARAAAEGLPLALVGSAPGVAATCAERLQKAHAGLKLPIVSDGYLDEVASTALVSRIKGLGRCVVLVGMGTPLQERWAWRLAEAKDATVVTVGGLFDFYSDRIPRAPIAVRELGLEWVFRLVQEPERLASRYVVGNPLFLARVWLQACGYGPRAPRALAPDARPCAPLEGSLKLAAAG
jgi:N-acetylglucosaminyldiphosphoundecaprenol N-acetyl-beta-D-mannosaminyltransferase